MNALLWEFCSQSSPPRSSYLSDCQTRKSRLAVSCHCSYWKDLSTELPRQVRSAFLELAMHDAAPISVLAPGGYAMCWKALNGWFSRANLCCCRQNSEPLIHLTLASARSSSPVETSPKPNMLEGSRQDSLICPTKLYYYMTTPKQECRKQGSDLLPQKQLTRFMSAIQ